MQREIGGGEEGGFKIDRQADRQGSVDACIRVFNVGERNIGRGTGHICQQRAETEILSGMHLAWLERRDTLNLPQTSERKSSCSYQPLGVIKHKE